MSKIVRAVVGFVMLFIPGMQAFGIQLLASALIEEVASLLAPKPNNGWHGDSLQISLSTDQPRAVAIGQTATAGSLATWQAWGKNNEYVILIVALADHKCDSLVGGWWGGRRMTINSDGSVQEAYADGHHNLWVTFYSGDWNQSADSELISQSGGRWTTNDRGRGVAYVKVKARYNQKAHPSGLSGLFQFVWEIKGAHLYDRRQDSSVGGSGTQRSNDASTWTWSNNAAVATEAMLRGFSAEDTSASVSTRARDVFHGLQLTDSAIPFTENVAAMNICDEPVPLKGYGSNLTTIAYHGHNTISITSATGLTNGSQIRIDAGAANEERFTVNSIGSSGGHPLITLSANMAYDHANYAPVDWALSSSTTVTEPRYTANGMLSCDASPEQGLEDLLLAQAGKLLSAVDRWVVLPGAARTPVPRPDGGSGATITDGDLRIDAQHTFTRDIPLDEIVNAVYGRFSDPSQQYSAVGLPARLSPADEAEDGGRKSLRYDLNMVTSFTQGQRIAEIFRRQNRRQMSASIALMPPYLCLEGADWIEWSSDRYGFDAFFEVGQATLKMDEEEFLKPYFTLAETDALVFAWDPSVDELDRDAPTTLASADPVLDLVTTIVVTPTTMTQGSATIPALNLNCDAIVDPLCVAIRWEWRVHGQPSGASSTFTKDFVVNPAANTSGSTSTYCVTEGVNGGLIYEARAIEVTRPDKPATWSNWYPAATATATLAAGTAGIANSITGQGPLATSTLTEVDVNNALIPANGVNRVRFSQFEKGATDAWGAAGSGVTAVSAATYVSGGITYGSASATSSSSGQWLDLFTQGIPVTAGERLAVQALVAVSGPATGAVDINWYNASGGFISQSASIGGAFTSSSATLRQGFVVAPTGAVVAILLAQANATGAGSISVAIGQPMVCGATSSQTAFPAFNPGPASEAGADVTLNWTAAAITAQGPLATSTLAETAVNNALIPAIGVNRVPYSQFEKGGAGPWFIGYNPGGLTVSKGSGVSAGINFLQYGATATAAGQIISMKSLPFAVTAGERLAVQACVDTWGNTTGALGIGFLNATGGSISEPQVAGVAAGTGWPHLVQGFVTAPAGATSAWLEYYGSAVAAGLITMSLGQPMVCGATAGQTVFPSFNPGPNSDNAADVTANNVASGIAGQAPAATDTTIASGATKNTVTIGTTAPSGPTAGDLWNDTSVTPNAWKAYKAGAWVVVSTNGGAFDQNMYESAGGSSATLSAFKTVLGVASAVSGQGPWATTSTPLASVLTPTTNLLYNPTGALGEQGWTIAASTLGSVIQTAGEGPYFHNSSSSNSTGCGQFQDIPCYPSNGYSLSAWVAAYGVTGTGLVRVYIEWLTSAKAHISYSGVAQIGAGTGWTYVSVQNQASPSNAAYARVFMDIWGSGSWSNNNAAWKLLKLENNSISTPWSDETTNGALYRDGATIDSLQPAQYAADVTGLNIAASISGQGALATLNQAAWATQVTGTGKPEDYATKSHVYRQAGTPSSPTTNDIWVKVDGSNNPLQVYAYSGSAWVLGADITALYTAAAISGQGTLATLNTVGSSTIDNLSVNTIHIADNAVSTTVAAYTSGSITIGVTQADITIQTATLTTHGTLVTIEMSFNYYGPTVDGVDITVKLKRDGTTIYSKEVTNSYGPAGGTFSAKIFETPSASSHTYTLTASGAMSETADSRGLIVQEIYK